MYSAAGFSPPLNRSNIEIDMIWNTDFKPISLFIKLLLRWLNGEKNVWNWIISNCTNCMPNEVKRMFLIVKTAYNFRLFAIILNSIWIHELLRFELDSFFTMNLSTKRKSYTHFWNTSGHYRYTFNGRFILEKLFLLLNATHCISPNPFHRANSELSILRVNHFPSVTHEIQRRSTDSAPRTFIHATQRVSDVLPPHGNASQRTWTLRSYDVSTKPSQYNQTTRAAHTAFPCVVR